MKGKGEQRTYWLLGEDEMARDFRTKERNERRGSRALVKANLQQPIKNIGSSSGPKSSLKSRSLLPRASLTRSSSLESPKKLRFATGTFLEHHRYHRYGIDAQLDISSIHVIIIIHHSFYCRYSDDALMEVISDSSPRKSRSGSIGCEDVTSSCPCIDHISDFGSFDKQINNSCPNATTPLLANHITT